MEIQLKIDDRKVQDLLNRLRDRAKNLTSAMQAIGVFYERSVLESFKAQSGPDCTRLISTSNCVWYGDVGTTPIRSCS